MESLKKPTQIYEGLFKELSNQCKFFLISLFCFEDHPVLLKEMEHSFKYLVIDEDYDLGEIEHKLEESWTMVRDDESFKNECIDFVNPSIVDFLSSKRNTSSMFNRISERTRYLSQVAMSSGVNDIYKKIESNYDHYYDKEMYAGEKISLLLKKEQINDKDGFIHLLFSFNGKYHPKDSSSKFSNKKDWENLLSEFYYSENQEAKQLFLKTLLYSQANKQLISSMLDNNSDLDGLSEHLSDLIEEVYNTKLEQNELIDFAEEETGVNLYSEVLYCKEKRLQEQVDDFYDIDNLLDLENLIYDEDDKDFAMEKIIEKHQEKIYQGLENTFFKSEIDNFELDFTDAEAYIEGQIDDYLYDLNNDNDDNNDGYDDLADTETIDSILGKPLE